MQPRLIATILIASGGLGCFSLLAGCGDETKTTGTQVQISPTDKAIDDQVRGSMKQDRAAERKEDAANRKGGGMR